jgi:hypothetical protein
MAPASSESLDPRTLEQRAPRGSGDSALLETRTAFERYELKYWVSEQIVERILRFAQPYMRHDPHARTRHAQRNTTLYLDTRGFRFCENHLALSPDRIKLRIRCYGLPIGDTAFFEVKRKMKPVTVKNRFRLPTAEVRNVLEHRRHAYVLPPGERRTFDDFFFHMRLHRAEPKLFVACYREAFESLIPGEDVRLTVDRELVYQPATGSDFTPNDRRWTDIVEGEDSRPAFGRRRAILELKFDESAPRWMVELVKLFGLQRVAFSKYTTAAQQLRGRL